jgi:hypothetical protein
MVETRVAVDGGTGVHGLIRRLAALFRRRRPGEGEKRIGSSGNYGWRASRAA